MNLPKAVFQCMVAGLTFIAGAVAVAGVSNPVQIEIRQLLAILADSGCEFNRNGNWYSGEKAGQHLARKLDYIEQRGTLKSTEQFIELAATKSSMSGRAYQVRCATSAPVPSHAWLLEALRKMRSERNAVTKGPG
jgi:hypothetical protein